MLWCKRRSPSPVSSRDPLWFCSVHSAPIAAIAGHQPPSDEEDQIHKPPDPETSQSQQLPHSGARVAEAEAIHAKAAQEKRVEQSSDEVMAGVPAAGGQGWVWGGAANLCPLSRGPLTPVPAVAHSREPLPDAGPAAPQEAPRLGALDAVQGPALHPRVIHIAVCLSTELGGERRGDTELSPQPAPAAPGPALTFTQPWPSSCCAVAFPPWSTGSSHSTNSSGLRGRRKR